MGNKESAMTKLNNEAATVSGYNVPAIAIRDHIAQRIMTDVIYAEKVIAEGKTLSKCYQYISDIAYEKARKMSNTDKRGGIMIGFVFLGLSAIFFLAVSAFSAGAGFGLSASSFFFSSSSESV